MNDLAIEYPIEFEWDKGNRGKNQKHRVTDEECEEAYFDPNKVLARDPLHSDRELRHILIGKTQNGRLLFVAFTVRKKKLRVISARDLNRRERFLYEKTA